MLQLLRARAAELEQEIREFETQTAVLERSRAELSNEMAQVRELVDNTAVPASDDLCL